jgi:uncharacterized membrane protein
MEPYDLVKYLHVVAAITAVGFNLSCGLWLTVTARTPEHRLPVLRTVKRLDDWIANPAYVVLLLSGLAMLAIGSIPITTAWILAALALYTLLVVLGLGVFSRALATQIRLLQDGSASPAAYDAVAGRTMWSGALLVVIALVIVFLMVTKPTL